jgi:hypothetical protein
MLLITACFVSLVVPRAGLEWQHQWELWTSGLAQPLLCGAWRAGSAAEAVTRTVADGPVAAHLWVTARVHEARGGLEGEITVRILRLAQGSGRTQEVTLRTPLVQGQPVRVTFPDLDEPFPPLWLEWAVWRPREPAHGDDSRVSGHLRSAAAGAR